VLPRKDKIVIEVMYKADNCLICRYMDEAIREVLPAYSPFVEYRRVDIWQGEGKRRFLELSVSLFGEEGVYRKLRVAPIPSLFIDGEIFFDTIPPRPLLEETLAEVIAKSFPEGCYAQGKD
jgi:hypothetical protein